MDLYQDAFHLQERGKWLLANNFIFLLNNCALTPPFNRHKAPLDCSEEKDLQI